jgi:hypothetical protein
MTENMTEKTTEKTTQDMTEKSSQNTMLSAGRPLAREQATWNAARHAESKRLDALIAEAEARVRPAWLPARQHETSSKSSSAGNG